MKNFRDKPKYFRVGYYGLNFPAVFQNKEYIYRGLQKDTDIRIFCEKIRLQFPQAHLLENKPVTEETKKKLEMNIQIFKVTPVAEEGSTRFKGKKVSEALHAYYEMNEVKKFVYNVVYFKDKNKDNEFESLWTTKITLTCNDVQPGLLNRSLVTGRETKEQCPIENAINSMVDKNQELLDIIKEHKEHLSLNVSPLTMVLNGVIDAAVMGGTNKYRDAFFSESYAVKYPEHVSFISHLQTLISDQIDILADGVVVHGQKCPEGLRPLQSKLEQQLRDMMEKDKPGSTEGSATGSFSGSIGPSPSLGKDSLRLKDDGSNSSMGPSPKMGKKSVIMTPDLAKKTVTSSSSRHLSPSIDAGISGGVDSLSPSGGAPTTPSFSRSSTMSLRENVTGFFSGKGRTARTCTTVLEQKSSLMHKKESKIVPSASAVLSTNSSTASISNGENDRSVMKRSGSGGTFSYGEGSLAFFGGSGLKGVTALVPSIADVNPFATLSDVPPVKKGLDTIRNPFGADVLQPMRTGTVTGNRVSYFYCYFYCFLFNCPYLLKKMHTCIHTLQLRTYNCFYNYSCF